MPRYKVGDVVVVRPDIECNKRYYMDDMTTYDVATESMCEFAGKPVTIESVKYLVGAEGNKYTVKEIDYWWTDDMFINEPDFEESDMPIENLLGVSYGRALKIEEDIHGRITMEGESYR